MYRPTVRYPDAFKEYVDALFMNTKLDRNQIFRLALFAAAHSEPFQAILKKHRFDDVPLPFPEWTLDDELVWKGNYYIASASKKKPLPKANVVRIKDSGGIKITLN